MGVRKVLWISALALCCGLASCKNSGEVKPESKDGKTKVNTTNDRPDSEAAAELIRKGGALRGEQKLDESFAAFKEAAELAEKEGSLDQQVSALALTARLANERGKLDEGRPYLDKAGELASQDFPDSYLRYLWAVGRYAYDEKDPDKAKTTYQIMHDYALAKEKYDKAVDATHMLAIIAESDEEKIKWSLEGIADAEKGGFTGWLAVLWNNLGWTYDSLKRYEDCLHALTQAKKYHDMGEKDLSKIIAEQGVGYAYYKCGKLDEADAAIASSHARFEKLVEEGAGDEVRVWIGQSFRHKAEIANLRKDKAKAIELIRQAIPLLKKGNPAWYGSWVEEAEALLKQWQG